MTVPVLVFIASFALIIIWTIRIAVRDARDDRRWWHEFESKQREQRIKQLERELGIDDDWT